MRSIFLSLFTIFILSGCMTTNITKVFEKAPNDFDNQEIKSKIAYKYEDEKLIKFNQFRYYEDSNDYSKGIITFVNVVKQDVFSIADITLRMMDEKKQESKKTIRCYVPPVDGIYQTDLHDIFMEGSTIYFVSDINNLASSYLVLHDNY